MKHVEPNDEVEIQLVREGTKKEIVVKLGKYRSCRGYTFLKGNNQCMQFSYRGGGYLGVKLQRMDQNLAQYFGVRENSGALILEIEEDSPAEKADLKSGDIIIEIDGEEISSPEDVHDVLSDLEEGDEIELKLIRNRKEKTFQAELDRKSWYFQMPGKKDCDIEDFKDFRDFRIDLPHIEIDVPEIDFEFKMDCDI
jgi:serine protease Do